MNPRISRAALQHLLDLAAASPDREICGLLLGKGSAIRAILPVANVAAEPARRFEIDPAGLVAAHRRARRRHGAQLLGYYHSHPTGLPDPSPRDAEAAAPDGMLWMILTADSARIWRATEAGERHGRFAPVAFDMVTGKRGSQTLRTYHRDAAADRWSRD